MEIEIKNIRSIASADIQVDRVALIAGRNGSGKSTIAQAIAAALTQDPAPGMKKNEAKLLLTDGQKRGKVSVTLNDNTATVNYPGGSTSSDLPLAHPVHVGLTSVPDMDARTRSQYLSGMLKSEPTQSDLSEALPDAAEKTLAMIWEEIETQGWDKAHARAKETGARLKGGWEQITGEKYGSNKAAEWCPPSLKPDDLPTMADLEKQISAAQSKVDEIQKSMALSDNRKLQLEEQVSEGKAAAKQISETEKKRDGLADQLRELETELANLPRPAADQQVTECPHCAGHVVIQGNALTVPAESDPKENEARQKAITDVQKRIQQTRHDLNNETHAVQFLQQQVDGGNQAANELKSDTGQATEKDLTEAREVVTTIMSHREDLNRYNAAAKKHGQIQQSAEIVKALAPDGIRKTVLERKLAEFNERLAGLCATAGWPVVAVTPDLSVTYGDRPHALLSASERYRCAATIQLAACVIESAQVAVIDAADILDKPGRNGLMKLVKSMGIRAVICMTMNDRADVPDIHKAGMGRSYWIEGGEVAPI
jgi:ABC-type dipeptide/oligopeptide/nickel transport system ATPase component